MKPAAWKPRRLLSPVLVAVACAVGLLSSCSCSNHARELRTQTEPARAARAQTADEVRVEQDSVRRARQYTLPHGDCRLSWIVFDEAPNKGVIQNRSACTESLAEQLPRLDRLLAAVIQDPAAAPPLSFIWGRLYPDVACDRREMSHRLALAAHRSPAWDHGRGRPRSGDPNTFVAEVARENMIYPELRDLFVARGLELRLVSVEKVLILPAGELNDFPQLQQAGVKAQERLPFDCLAYFSVARRN